MKATREIDYNRMRAAQHECLPHLLKPNMTIILKNCN